MFMIQRHFISFHENLPEHLRQLSSYHVMVARVKMSWQLFCLSFLKAALWSGRRWIQRQFELFAIISTCSVSWGKCFPPDLTLDGQIARSERRHLPMQGPLEFVLQNGIRQGFFKWSILWFPRRNATCSINPAFSAFWFRYPSCFLVSVDIVNAGLLCFFQSELFHEQLFLVLTVFCTMFYLLPSCFSFFKFPHAVLLGPWAVCMSCTLAVGEPESATQLISKFWTDTLCKCITEIRTEMLDKVASAIVAHYFLPIMQQNGPFHQEARIVKSGYIEHYGDRIIVRCKG